jgi:putative DNA primase/helicase
MNDAHDRFAPLTDGQRSAHQMKECQKPDDGELVVPVPPDAPAAPASHIRLGKWAYRNLIGEVLGYISRFDPPEGRKVFLPLTLQRTVRGLRWFWKALPEPRPLYGREHRAARPEAPVLICEGEKAADAAQQIFPGYVAVTSPGGAAAASKADWESLRGRETVMWPDNDQSGADCTREVAEILGDRECAVSVIDISQLVEIDGGKRAADRTFDGWDAADAIAEWSDLGALRPASSSQSWPADHRHFRRCGRVAKQPTRTSWGAR